MFFCDKTLKYDDKNANNYDEKFFYSDYSVYICFIKLKDMKELSKTIVGRGEVKGYIFTQIENNGLGYIYEKKCVETNKISYEVFKRKENKYFDCISYPSSKSFGVWAWDVQNLPYAIEVLATFKEKIV